MPSRTPSKPPTYYYAHGKRVPLVPAVDLVAVDEARLANEFPGQFLEYPSILSGRLLRDGIRLIDLHTLPAGIANQLHDAGVTQPVFRAEGSVLVALPEIRVEDKVQAKLEKSIVATRGEALAETFAGRLTLRPNSADGGDAIRMANQLVERIQVASASPRFIRVVPGPGPIR